MRSREAAEPAGPTVVGAPFAARWLLRVGDAPASGDGAGEGGCARARGSSRTLVSGPSLPGVQAPGGPGLGPDSVAA